MVRLPCATPQGRRCHPHNRCGFHRSPEQHCSLAPFYRGGNGSLPSELGLDLMCSTWKPQVSPGCQWPWVIQTQEGKHKSRGVRGREKAGEGRRRESSEGPLGRLEEGRRARAGRESVEGKGVEEGEGTRGEGGRGPSLSL